MKKIITKIALGLILVGVFGGVLTALPNELAFKFYNQQGISDFKKKDWKKSRENFRKAVLKFNPWKLVGENNQLAILYEQKKYSEVGKKLEPILKNECSLSAEKIPSFCENIFYLAGLTQYRLGENLSSKEQKPFFERAIFNFQKTLVLNPQNTWAKENIDFILNKFAEKQQQEQQKQDQKSGDKNQKDQQKNQSGGDSKDKKDEQSAGNKNDEQNSSDQKNQQNSAKNESGESGEKNKDQQKSSQKDAGSEGKKQSSADQNKDGQNGQDGKTAENSAGGNQENSAKNQPAPSRLPQDIQQALEQVQQELEQNQNQKGFNRSRSAAENQQNSRDPFQDDFFQDFFGNDPFFNSFFGGRHEKKFHKNISNPNEKDW